MQLKASQLTLMNIFQFFLGCNGTIVAFFGIFVVSFTIISSVPVQAAQTIPYKVNFQGRLTDAAGNIKTDGLYNMRVRLYSAATGGTAAWTETREAVSRVQVTNGLFSIQLGDVTALSPSLFTTYPLYLEIELPTPATANCSTASCGIFTEGAMTPRSALGSSPYAFNADTVDGIDGSSLARNDASNTFSVGSTNTFNGKTQLNDTLSIVNGKAIGFNITQSGSNLQLQAASSGGYIMNDATGLSIGAVSAGSAGAGVNAPATMKLVANNPFVQAAIDGGVTYGDNLIANPGFEFGCAGWFGCDAVSAVSPSSGASHFRFTQASTATTYEISSRTIAVQPGDQLYVQAKVKTSAPTTGQGGYYIRWMNAAGDVISFSNGDWTNPGTSYATKSSTVTAPAGAVYAAIELTVRGSTGTTAGTWDFDDVYVKQVNQTTPILLQNSVNSMYAFAIQNAAGSPLLVADTSNFEVRIGDGDVDPNSTPTLLVLDHKSTTGDPTGYNGAMYYNASVKKFRCYEDGAWKNCVSTMLDPKMGYNYQSEFTNGVFTNNVAIDSTVSAYQASGSLTQQNNDGGSHPGILAASANSTTSIAGYIAPSMNITLSTGDWSYLSSVKLSAVSGGSGIYTFRSGFINALTTAGTEGGITNGCYVRSTNTVDAGQWQGVCRNSSAETVCTIPVAVSNAWTTINVAVSGNGATATFTINDTNQCSVSSNIPTAEVSIGSQIHKAGGGATPRTASIDYVDVRGRFSR